ncbi:MAG: endonuclease/exonuclease/phosphatase, partial [uncultured bacterium (gcode 4)]
MKSSRCKLTVLLTALIFAVSLSFGCKMESPAAELPKVASQEKVKQKHLYKYAQSNAYNLGESKIKSKAKFKGEDPIPSLQAFARLYNGFDIIGIQEISTGPFGAKALGMLRDNLSRKGEDWGMLYSDPTNGPGLERFGVLFRKSKFVELSSPYSGLVKELDDDIDREPYHAVLKEKSTGKLLHIYIFHLLPVDKDPGREAEAVGRHADL